MPWPLFVYVIMDIVGPVVGIASGSTSAGLIVFMIIAFIVWNFFLLSGLRWLWLVTVGFGVLSLVINLAFGPRTWWGLGIGVLSLVLLLHPDTRKFFGNEEPAPAT